MSDAGRPDFTWEEFDQVNQTEAPKEAGRFKPCYRHADSTTGITCQRCSRPICGACMQPASVGFLCPECGGAGAAQASRPRRRSLPADSPWRGASPILFGTVGILSILNRVLGDALRGFLGWHRDAIAAGQVWRMLTGALVEPEVLNLIITVLMGFLIGRSVEAQLGTARFCAGYGISVLGASLMLSIAHYPEPWPLCFSGIFGLFAAMAVLKYSVGQDIRGDLVLLGILIVANVALGWRGGGPYALVGATLLGGVAGAVMGYVRRDRTQWMWLGAVAAVTAIGSFGAALL